jgi:hypothetical protein
VNLALGRDVDEEVAVNLGATAEPAVGGEAPKPVVFGLVGAARREVAAARFDPCVL